EPSLFSHLVAEDHPQCLVEQAVNAHLSATLLEAEAVLLKKFERVTIAMLAGEVETSALRSKSSRAGNQ
ncbi:MAG: transcriptional regulator, partial [Pandoraea pnomenusa]|nr:transcriptional regulator [Pandoraea pnomenusa]